MHGPDVSSLAGLCPECESADAAERLDPIPMPTVVPDDQEPIPHPCALTRLGPLNYYLICDPHQLVAHWQNDSRGWMLHRRDGFVRVAHVAEELPWFGEFVLVEIGMERQSDGIRITHVSAYALQEEFALIQLVKSDTAILKTITGVAALSDRQKDLVREFVKAKYLRPVWHPLDELLEMT